LKNHIIILPKWGAVVEMNPVALSGGFNDTENSLFQAAKVKTVGSTEAMY